MINKNIKRLKSPSIITYILDDSLHRKHFANHINILIRLSPMFNDLVRIKYLIPTYKR